MCPFMNFTHRLERWLKPRFAVIYPFGFFVVFFCWLTDASLMAGIGYIIAGLLVRLWSNGYAIKNDKLTTSGPYAFVRNPLYLGTFLIAISFVFVLTSDPPILEKITGIIFLLALIFMYYRTIRAEQGMLLAKFKDAYKDYCKHVPVILPYRLTPYTKGEKWPFNLQRLLKSKEHKTVFWIFILLVVFYLKDRLLIEHKPLTEASWTLIGMALSLVFLDILYEINKKKFK
jgi:protein-S-isoprenylcysteine O-methyltransferase Ste14